MKVLSNDIRLIFYHQQATSARTLFLRFKDRVCAFETLPSSAQLLETAINQPIIVHPTTLVTQAEQHLGLSSGYLEIERAFCEQMNTVSGQLIQVYLARFTTIDPPYELATQIQGHFISIMEARDLGPIELELLRRAYALIMGG